MAGHTLTSYDDIPNQRMAFECDCGGKRVYSYWELAEIRIIDGPSTLLQLTLGMHKKLVVKQGE